MPDKLIIFDYSGTLSPEMAVFAHSDNLLRELHKSGLSALGVNNANLFWDIVDATWIAGSTSQMGYTKVMQERITEMFSDSAIDRQAEIAVAVKNFVGAYLAHSRIDEHWLPILEKLSKNKTVQVIIATDHYAEATGAIIGHLHKWGLRATMINEHIESNFIVANSADIGVHKVDKRFWEIVKKAFKSEYNKVLLIDDFGQNEQQNDNYGSADKIADRREKTIQLLGEIFAAEVKAIEFVIGDKSPENLIAKLSARIDRFISK